MKEYVEKSAILAKCEELWNAADETTQTGVDTINAIDKITDYIESLPEADVQPVIRAEWVLFDRDSVGRAFYCSNCRKVTTTDDFEDTPLERDEYFCMRCGADMRNSPNSKGED